MSRNVNKQHKQTLTKSERLAVWITNHIGTMYCVFLFALIGTGSLIGVISNNAFLAILFGAFSSYFLQLVLLPLIMLGQNIQQRHAELVAEEDYQTDVKNELETMEIHRKLDVLNSEIKIIKDSFIALLKSVERSKNGKTEKRIRIKELQPKKSIQSKK